MEFQLKFIRHLISIDVCISTMFLSFRKGSFSSIQKRLVEGYPKEGILPVLYLPDTSHKHRASEIYTQHDHTVHGCKRQSKIKNSCKTVHDK